METPTAGDQPLPTEGVGAPVSDQVKGYLDQRKELGIRRYGKALQAHNGRDPLRDAFEEAVDLTMYLGQVLIERDGHLPEVPDA